MSIHPVIESLLTEIEDFRLRHRMSVTAFGKESVGDAAIIRRLSSHSPTLRTLERIRSFMDERDGVSV